jgi:hypothetical protein
MRGCLTNRPVGRSGHPRDGTAYIVVRWRVDVPSKQQRVVDGDPPRFTVRGQNGTNHRAGQTHPRAHRPHHQRKRPHTRKRRHLLDSGIP